MKKNIGKEVWKIPNAYPSMSQSIKSKCVKRNFKINICNSI